MRLVWYPSGLVVCEVPRAVLSSRAGLLCMLQTHAGRESMGFEGRDYRVKVGADGLPFVESLHGVGGLRFETAKGGNQ